MTRDTTKTLGGWIVVLGHLLILALIATLGNIAPEQRRTIAFTLAPVLTAYFIGLVKWFSADADPSEARTSADTSLFVLSIFVPSLLLSTALFLVVSYPNALADTGDTLQDWIMGIEVAMGATVGLIVNDLFPRSDASR